MWITIQRITRNVINSEIKYYLIFLIQSWRKIKVLLLSQAHLCANFSHCCEHSFRLYTIQQNKCEEIYKLTPNSFDTIIVGGDLLFNRFSIH